MKVRKTVPAIIISVLLILCILLFAVAANSSNLTQELITSFLTSYNSENPSFVISYDSINPTVNSGITLDGLCVGNGEENFFSVSEVNVSAGIADMIRMVFGKNPNAIEVSVKGSHFLANEAFIESVENVSKNSSSKKGNSSFSLPFVVEINVSKLWADVEIEGCRSSIGNIDAFARLDRKGLAVANVTIPFISALTPAGNVYAEDLRLSSDSSYDIRLSAAKISLEDKVSSTGLSAIGQFKDEKINLTLEVPQTSGFGTNIYNTAVVASYGKDGLLADISLKKASYGFDEGPFDLAWIGDIMASVSWNTEDGLKARGKAGLFASSNLAALGNFTADAELFAEIPDFNDIVSSSVFCAKVKNMVCPVLDGKNSLEAYLYNLDDVRLSASLFDGLDVAASFVLSELSGVADISFNSLLPQTIKKPLKEFFPKSDSVFIDGTELNGQVFAEFAVKDRWFDAELEAGLDITDVLFMSGLRNAHADLKASATEGIVSFDKFEITADDYVATYDGSMDLSWLGFSGELSAVNRALGKGLADFKFVYTGENSYHMQVSSESFDKFILETDVTYLEKGKYDVSSLLVTQLATYPVNVSIDALSDFALTVSDSANEVKFLLGRDKILKFEGLLGGLDIQLKKNRTLGLSGELSGRVNTQSLEFEASLNKFGVSFADLVKGNFDMVVTDKSVNISSMAVFLKDSKIPVTGKLAFEFEDIKKILSIDFEGVRNLKREAFEAVDLSALTVKGEFGTAEGDSCRISYKDRLLMAYVDSNYIDIPVKINAMGSLKDVLYADVKFGDVSFELSYQDEKARIYKGSGKIADFDIAGLEAEVDTRQHTMNGSMNLVLTLENLAGDVTSKADFDFSARLIRLGDILEGKFFSGSEFEVAIEMKDGQISDTLPLADTDINLSYSDGVVLVNGKLINGEYRFSDGFVRAAVNPDFLFGFEAEGYIGKNVDVSVTDILFPIEVVNPLINVPMVTFLEGDITGSLLLHGPIEDVMFYGMLYCNSFDMEVFYLPDQRLTINNIAVVANEHTISIPFSPFVGYSTDSSDIFEGRVKVEAIFRNTKFENFEVSIDVDDTPFDFWLPLNLGTINLNLRGSVYNGNVQIGLDSTGKLSIIGDACASDFFGSFVFPDNMPKWFFKGGAAPIIDMRVTTGKNVEFCYPRPEDSLVSLTCKENEKVRILLDRYGNFSSEGDFAVNTGRVYYFNNDFYVTDGHVYFEDNPLYGNGFQIYIDVGAKTRQYDSNGNPLDIYLTMNKATFDNMSMRFSSSSSLTENEIIQILGQAVLPTSEGLSLSSVASFAYAATDVVQKLNLVDSNETPSITEALRQALGLDFLSARSPLLANILLDALPGEDSGVSLLSKYLNGTSVFAGKYHGNNIFSRVILLLEADASARTTGHFLTDDLAVDIEFSLEWDNPLATFTVFTKPQELSAFGFLDTIGLTVSKTLRY